MYGNWIKTAILMAATRPNTAERIAHMMSMPRA